MFEREQHLGVGGGTGDVAGKTECMKEDIAADMAGDTLVEEGIK